ncbi:MAG: hypothetical protein ACTHJR_12630 [Sphingomonas sp.]|uniref:hypothetical protein n=1 Tax=Sphingomonas sp. TaxID=28214 RepID=UPI003F7ED9AF
MTETATNQPDPAQAFEAVRRELSLLHSAVAGLAAEREKIPDYGETLGRIAYARGEHNKRLAAIEHSRAISLSPVELVKEITKAAETVRIEDRRMLDTARSAFDQALGRVDGMIRRGQATDRQVKRERWHAAAGLLIGMLIWAVLPGAIARSLPASWHVPEWMAARTMGVRASEAGQRPTAPERPAERR